MPKQRTKAEQNEYYKIHKYQIRQNQIRYESKNRDKIKNRMHQYYLDNKERITIRNNDWYLNNKERVIQKKVEYHRTENRKEITKRYRDKLKMQVLSHYSPELNCKCCGEKHLEFLSIHHVNGNGYQHRKQISGNLYRWLVKNNYPEGYEILCMNCNCAIGRFGECPHKSSVRS